MFIKIFLICLLAVVVHFGYKFYLVMDVGKKLYNHYPGPCHRVEGIDFGSENLHMLPNGITFITSGFALSRGNSPGFEEFYAKNKIKGRIFMFNMKNPKKVAEEMTLTSTKDFDRDRFQPHGISAYEDKKSGKLYLFVVSHEKDGIERIEKFLVSMETLTLTHIKSYSNPVFTLLNDVVATGEDSFYFTNMASMKSQVTIAFEMITQMPWSNIGYFDGKDYNIVVDGLQASNGIQMSLDGRYLYGIASNSRDLRIYDRRGNNSLHLKEKYTFNSGPDNVVVDPLTGDLYVALHPVGSLMFGHMSNPENIAPSQVLQIKLKEGKVLSVMELFADDGHMIKASTVATVYNKRMLVGSFIDKLVYCDVNIPL